MRRRHVVLAGAAAVVLAAGSVTAVAATSSRPGPTWPGPGMMHAARAPLSSCRTPDLPGAQVTVMLADMAGGMMTPGTRTGRGRMMDGGSGPMMDGRSGPMMNGWSGRTAGGGWSGSTAAGGHPTAGAMMLRAAPQRVAAGQVSLVATNHGSRAHELVVLPLAPDTRVGARAVGADRRVAETGSLGEASRSCGAGAGDGIAAGSAGWVTLTLAPGRYELLCNLPGHYAAGMYAELDVI